MEALKNRNGAATCIKKFLGLKLLSLLADISLGRNLV